MSATWGRDCFGAAAPGDAPGVDDELDAALHHLLHFLLMEEVGVRFDYLVDDTPAKVGKFTPGLGCEIRPLAALAAEAGPATRAASPPSRSGWRRTMVTYSECL